MEYSPGDLALLLAAREGGTRSQLCDHNATFCVFLINKLIVGVSKYLNKCKIIIGILLFHENMNRKKCKYLVEAIAFLSQRKVTIYQYSLRAGCDIHDIMADFEDGRLLALQRYTNLKSTTI